MKIHQLLSNISIPLSNEEHKFVESYDTVRLTALNERDRWLAQNLVRKGVYDISKDNLTLSKKTK